MSMKKCCFMSVDAYPKVIVNDRDIVIMNAITMVFSKLVIFYVVFRLIKM